MQRSPLCLSYAKQATECSAQPSPSSPLLRSDWEEVTGAVSFYGITGTPSALLSGKYHRGNLLKSADVYKGGTVCTLFGMAGTSHCGEQNNCPQKAVSSSAQPRTTIVSYHSSVNSQSPTSNRVLIWDWRRGKVLGLRARCFLALPLLQGTISVFSFVSIS